MYLICEYVVYGDRYVVYGDTYVVDGDRYGTYVVYGDRYGTYYCCHQIESHIYRMALLQMCFTITLTYIFKVNNV